MIIKDKESFVQGMEFAMRICRNQVADNLHSRPDYARGAELCAGVIRIVQVEIGAGRMPLPEFSQDEIDEIEIIS